MCGRVFWLRDAAIGDWVEMLKLDSRGVMIKARIDGFEPEVFRDGPNAYATKNGFAYLTDTERRPLVYRDNTPVRLIDNAIELLALADA